MSQAGISSEFILQCSQSNPFLCLVLISNSRCCRFFKDIEINDLRNRYLLTKGPTQQQVSAFEPPRSHPCLPSCPLTLVVRLRFSQTLGPRS